MLGSLPDHLTSADLFRQVYMYTIVIEERNKKIIEEVR